MKYLVKFIVVTFFLLISTHTFAEQKIVILDLTFVLNNSKAGKGAQDFLKKSFTDNAKKFSDLENKLKKEESDLLSKKTVMSKEEYTKKTDALRKKVIDFQSQRRGALDKITTQRSESREVLLKTVEPILDEYIKFLIVNTFHKLIRNLLNNIVVVNHMKIIIVSIILVSLCFLAICVKIILKKNGEFSGTCASKNPFFTIVSKINN